VDLGMMAPANHYRRPQDRWRMEPTYPLHAWVCGSCLLVQLEAFQTPEQLFADYAYFSSYSDSWVCHAEHYVEAISDRLALDENSLVIEVASNDGYLLQHVARKGISAIGIEPAGNVAAVAREKGIDTRVAFFGTEFARGLAVRGEQADLLIGNNVLAHVPDLNDFVAGLKLALKPGGTITLEFPHLLRLIAETQFDTIYHEHFSYFSALTVDRIASHHGLQFYDVERLPTHGGSLRVYLGHTGSQTRSDSVARVLADERAAGLDRLETYRAFGDQVRTAKRKLLSFLIDARNAGQTVVGYGAPAKGNTLLGYCGVGPDLLDYTVDRSPHKQGLLLPGTGIAVEAPEKIFETKPDFVLILPWNIRDEIVGKMAGIGAWGGRFVIPIPEPTILEPAAVAS